MARGREMGPGPREMVPSPREMGPGPPRSVPVEPSPRSDLHQTNVIDVFRAQLAVLLHQMPNSDANLHDMPEDDAVDR